MIQPLGLYVLVGVAFIIRIMEKRTVDRTRASRRGQSEGVMRTSMPAAASRISGSSTRSTFIGKTASVET